MPAAARVIGRFRPNPGKLQQVRRAIFITTQGEVLAVSEPTKEEADAVIRQYDGLYSYIETKTSPNEPLLLAHYTSVEVA